MMDRANFLLFISWFLIHLFTSCLAANILNITTDQSALIVFKSQFEHDHSNVLARNWSSDTPICSWIGVTCSFRHHRVAAINVSNMELSGIIPPELGNLSFLVSLDMSGNKLHGDLPKELAKLKRLKFIGFSFNRFSGKIPSFFEAMPNLQQLRLRNCSFTGSIPPSLSNISKLEALDLAYNSLEGTIPVEIGNLGRLKILSLGWNKFSGAIPDSIFNVSTLEILEFTYNSLSGNLPASMCRNLPSLTFFSVYSNQLYGQIPSTIGECSQLRTLALQLNQFNGRIPKQIGNLSMLVYLYLGDNNFEGEIPAEIGNLANLEYLILNAVGLNGPIPSFIYNISTLQFLHLNLNNLTGNLPMEICLQLPAIQKLSLGQNQLTGSIPRKLGNCSSLVELYLEENMFTGGIPSEIGNLLNLQMLNLEINYLTYIPTAIFNISTLKRLSVYENQITGSLPSTMGKQLPSLEQILLGHNNLTGSIPDSISNASKLAHLSLVANKLNGRIPNSLGELKFLDFLNIGENDFTSEVSEMSFITSLTKCRRLRIVWMGINSFGGYLPDSIGNFSSSLEQLDLSNSRIKGRIPKEIGNITNLAFLYMDNNEFTGFVPFIIEGLRNLQVLSLMGNKLSGPIPDGICHLPNLGELTLSKNKLYGPLPACLGNITSLRYLYLDSNELKSSISPTIGGLKDLLVFNLFSNFLSGPLPLEIGNLKVVTSMDLSMNELSGSIPSTLGGLNNLITLSLAQNRLHGPILDSASKMLGLEGLDLSHNNFTGSIPKSMEKLQHLHYLNLSFNKLTGEIPNGGPFAYFNYQSFISNAALCGPRRLQVPPCPSNHDHRSRHKAVLLRASLISFVVVSTIVSLIISFFLIKRQRKNRVPSDQMDSFPAVMPERIRYHDLQRATNGFSEANLLGVGSFGSVYIGTFTDGTVAAIKVFNLHIEAAFRSFDIECEILRSLRHRNLAKVKSSCSNIDFRALVLEYMPNGSLENWLYSHDRLLNLSQRLSIMIDVASAIEYLHHGYTTPVVHCDLKPTNVLLDDAMVARVSDFGIAKLVYAEDNVVLTGTLATFGYIAPEYGSEGLVSTKCDVYSFGIMLMETFTRKRPTDDLFTAGLSLRCWIYDSYPHSLGHVIDATLLNSEEESFDKTVECISLIMKLALDCSSELPGERINMKDARATLQKIRKLFFPHL